MLEVIEEAAHWLAVCKPAGLVVEAHPFASPSAEARVAQYLSERVRHPYVGVVHRLDKPVSGVLLFAKRRSALRRLHAAFRERLVGKYYLAVVETVPARKRGTLTHWLGRSADRRRAIALQPGQRGAARCHLEWRVRAIAGQAALLELKPHSGRFHQLRAQLSLAGMPIMGDARYGSRQPWAPDAIALHAWRLRFPYPDRAQWHEVSCLPKGANWEGWLRHAGLKE